MNKIAIVGAGTFGTSIAHQLSFNPTNKTTLFVRGEKQKNEIKKNHTNKKYLPNFKLNPRVKATNDFSKLKSYEVVVLAIPSGYFSSYEKIFVENINKEALVINMSKGLLDGGISIYDHFNSNLQFKNFVSLKGPSFSTEVLENQPTLLTLGYESVNQVSKIRDIFEQTNFYFDFTRDINGVEYLSALKNIYAIFMGNIDGKFNSKNTRFFILTQCFKEMGILLKYLDCDSKTINLGCGLGDFCLTALSDMSRNRTLGLIIGKGFFNISDTKNSVVLEGIKTLHLLNALIESKLLSNLPILKSLFNLFIYKKTKTLKVNFESLLKNKFKTVLTYGTFDLLHYGHLEILKRAKDYGHKLIVGLSTDEFNLTKGKVCEFSYGRRKKYLESLDFVDLVIPEDTWDQKENDVKNHNIDYFIMGDDWKGKFDFLSEHCDVIYLPRTEGISTTQLKNLLNEKNK
jgi:glycerol-3-phosphate dehydrogenase (NAD(P)+)